LAATTGPLTCPTTHSRETCTGQVQVNYGIPSETEWSRLFEGAA
jgi:hypothetical protein